MSRFGRVRRRPDHWSTPHERACFRAAERIDAQLDPAEESWLNEHLGGCDECRAVAEAYDADRLALRSLRDITPEPPRDLWARTAARIEREAGGRGRSLRPTALPARLPVGALSGIVVIVIVLGATALSGGWLLPGSGVDTAQASSAGGTTIQPGATPMSVAAGPVGWLHTLRDGEYGYNVAALDEVCPIGDQPDCAALDDQAFESFNMAAAPKSVIGSPTN
jgi:anti-sigma factor RsiW